ncbi:hypothetical protein [Pseudomonas sp. PSKL.D1]|uniref:hypothetical protein n=1 Tax=Pseudomonas sp. PSKL.D1 TaxID=3029060 RepID=UPI00238118CF|nr:hypothetical protein [Pseudomonas sp. PSKL.D1]WDY60368.1 hypothetical protein PVV54_12300 [Pseudomonas sp. PSKL.D1]
MQDPENIVDETLAITEHQVRDFLEAFRVPMACDCADGEHDLVLNPDNQPNLLAIPDPRDEDLENWFFWLNCNCCGHARMISASRVWTWIKTKDQDDE